MLRLFPYDLVLMDCQMPYRNGQAAAIEIRKRDPPGRHTPVVAMTAETGVDCLDDCLASGMDDILLKPIRREKTDGNVAAAGCPQAGRSVSRWVAPPGVDEAGERPGERVPLIP